VHPVTTFTLIDRVMTGVGIFACFALAACLVHLGCVGLRDLWR
jgi:hypothetical protein